MDNLLFIYVLFSIFLVGCTQNHPSSLKDDAFTNYVNSNTQQEETTNQQSNAIVNVAY